MISCFCPHCHAQFAFDDALAGRKARCEQCDTAFIAPAPGSENVVASLFQEPPFPVPMPQPASQPLPSPIAKEKKRRPLLPWLVLLSLAGAGIYYTATRIRTPQTASAQPKGTKPYFTLTCQPPELAQPARRASHFEEALELAKEGKRDIVILQRGSDWNRIGETLYHDIWTQESFARALGDAFVMLTVDRQEAVSAAPLPPMRRDSKGNPMLPEGQPPQKTPVRFLSDLADEKIAPPANDLVSVTTEGKAPFTRRADGAFVVDGTNAPPNPAQDILTLKLKPAREGHLIRLDFLTDPSLPGNGPGRASNGNFALSEIEIAIDAKPVKADTIWASHSEGHWIEAYLIDGITNKTDNGWNSASHQHKRRTVILSLPESVRAGGDIVLRLHAKSPWGQHTPGCMCAAVLADPAIASAVKTVYALRTLQVKNSAFTWQDNTYCPRIALLDSKGCGVACLNNIFLDMSDQKLLEAIQHMRDVRLKRDERWAQADKESGSRRAELLRQGMAMLFTEIGSIVNYGVWKGNGNCYKWVWDEVAKADPKEETWALRWLNTGLDPRCGVAGMEQLGKLMNDGKYQEALDLVDATLADPRFKIFSKDHKQRLLNQKFTACQRWGKGHEEQLVKALRDMVAVDPATYLGLGALGDMVRHWQVPKPRSITYGWGASQVVPGMNRWSFDMGLDLRFDHAGPYKIRIRHNAGKDTVKLLGIRLKNERTGMDLAATTPAAGENEIGPGKVIELAWRLNPETWAPDRKLLMELEVQAEAGKTECGAAFDVEPQLDETEFPGKIPPARDYAALQQELASALLASPEQTSPKNASLLARHELLRACGAEALNRLQNRPGGTTLLEKLFSDPLWIEMLLLGNPPSESYLQTLDNLRLLNRYVDDLDRPIYRRMLTAFALQGGKTLPYRLLTSFQMTQKAHREQRLHPSFDLLDVRSLREAVFIGSPQDFEYLLSARQMIIADSFGACSVWYRMNNDFGTSIHGGGYHEPWNWCWPAWRVAHQVGGVCGTLSTFGSLVTRAHGIPSHTVGQPGHCAYVVRVGQEWPVGNSVTWPTYTGAPGWDGTGYSTFHRLYEPVMAETEKRLAASRLLWLSRLQKEAVTPQLRLPTELGFQRYALPNGTLPDFSKLTPVQEGTSDSFSLDSLAPGANVNVGLVWTGRLEVVTSGPFLVALNADDVARILIDNKEIVRVNCQRLEKELALAQGSHELRVEYVQAGGAYHLAVSITGVSRLADWVNTAERAIAAHPLNYGVWMDYVRMLETVKEVPPQRWRELARRAADTFAVCNEAGWAMVKRCYEKGCAEQSPAQRFDFLLACNQDLVQDRWLRPEGYQIEGFLNWQADCINDPDLAVKLFKRMLALHRSKIPENNWIFGQVMNWGANRFAANKATSAKYASAMEGYFYGPGGTTDKNQMSTTILTNIRKASEAGDMQSYSLWSDMAEKFLPALSLGDIHLNPASAKLHPGISPFPGTLLSKDGMLRSSSACGYDRPRSYRAIVTDSETGGYLDTNHEPKPWAMVQLLGPCEVAGIVLVDRFEYNNPKDQNQETELRWLTPFKVSLSPDGRTWTDVATVTEPSTTKVYRVDCNGRKTTTQYVRVDVLPDPKADPKAQPGRLHLRHFLVYGKKLY